jgi:hypothetical protein
VIVVRGSNRNQLPSWIDAMYPTDFSSCRNLPTMAPTRHNNSAEVAALDLSNNIEFLLSLGMFGLSMFQGPSSNKKVQDIPE